MLMLTSFVFGSILSFTYCLSRSEYHSQLFPAQLSNQQASETKETANLAPLLTILDYPGSTRVVDMHLRNTPRNMTDSVVILTPANDKTSWGRDRTFVEHLAMLASVSETKANLSLGLLLSNAEEFYRLMCWLASNLSLDKSTLVKEHVDCKSYPINVDVPELVKAEARRVLEFNRITLVLQSNFNNLEISREHRHDGHVQRERRRMIARYRNLLQSIALRQEEAVLWIDADMVHIPKDMLPRMQSSKLDIIVPTCNVQGSGYYDYNTWKGPRAKPSDAERQDIAEGRLFVPHGTEETKFLFHFADGPDEFVEIDSVGGTVLFVQSYVIRQGCNFPVYYIIGGEWEYEGYDGIETEGLCYVAKRLGYKCWGMPKMVAEHHPLYDS
jgi:mannan polymerase complexes MNN9 subunit